MRKAVESQPYLWANLIMIDDTGAAAVEVRGDRTEATELAGPAARSNHHVVLKPHPDDDDTVTTEKRLASAQHRLGEAGGIDDVLALQRSHDDGDTGICNHEGYRTVYSYVLRHKGNATALHVAQGQPCTEPELVELTVPLGAHWSAAAARDFRNSYPSAQAPDDL